MKKAAFVAVAGAPNVGKSTLVNNLVGTKLSIVSPKVQTTRTTLKAIYNNNNTQLIFVDTPGIFSPKRILEEAIVNTAWQGLEGIDIIIQVIDSTKGFNDEAENITNKLNKAGIKPILIINKCDLITKEKKARLIEEFKQKKLFSHIFAVSARTHLGIKELLDFLELSAPANEWYFPEDQLTTESLRTLSSELTREKLFIHLNDELPFNLTVETDSWEEQKDNSIKIHQSIYVTKNSHKQIILGNKGAMIKKIGSLARKDIEELSGNKIHLFLFVKVREEWLNDPKRYQYLNMAFKKRKH